MSALGRKQTSPTGCRLLTPSRLRQDLYGLTGYLLQETTATEGGTYIESIVANQSFENDKSLPQSPLGKMVQTSHSRSGHQSKQRHGTQVDSRPRRSCRFAAMRPAHTPKSESVWRVTVRLAIADRTCSERPAPVALSLRQPEHEFAGSAHELPARHRLQVRGRHWQ